MTVASPTRAAPGTVPPGPGPRLLGPASLAAWPDHLAHWGPLPGLDPDRLIRELEPAAIRGRGGAAFPTARKVAAVAAAARRRGSAVVLVNACESDPTSGKDAALIARSPHLVIDGALVLAAAVGATRVVLAVAQRPAGPALADALAGRPDARTIEMVAPPPTFVASEATALVRFLNTGDARPAGRATAIWERGVSGRPTLVLNAETTAQVALVARFGAPWFAAVGAAEEPGTALVTISGAVTRPGVLEVPVGVPVGSILRAAGATDPAWAMVGGLGGRWIDLRQHGDIPWSAAGLAVVGASRGVGSLIVLPPGGCVLDETARIMGFLAEAGARQCGPCMFGLPAIAADLAELSGGDRGAWDRLHRRLPVIDGRGACAHPDGAVGLVGSALRALASREPEHLARHLDAGRCSAPPPVVPLGPSATGVRR